MPAATRAGKTFSLAPPCNGSRENSPVSARTSTSLLQPRSGAKAGRGQLRNTLSNQINKYPRLIADAFVAMHGRIARNQQPKAPSSRHSGGIVDSKGSHTAASRPFCRRPYPTGVGGCALTALPDGRREEQQILCALALQVSEGSCSGRRMSRTTALNRQTSN